jgi:hypothetical protein
MKESWMRNHSKSLLMKLKRDLRHEQLHCLVCLDPQTSKAEKMPLGPKEKCKIKPRVKYSDKFVKGDREKGFCHYKTRSGKLSLGGRHYGYGC